MEIGKEKYFLDLGLIIFPSLLKSFFLDYGIGIFGLWTSFKLVFRLKPNYYFQYSPIGIINGLFPSIHSLLGLDFLPKWLKLRPT